MLPIFANLLTDHPNQPFVQSVLAGLREGFWPWAETPDDYPETFDATQHPPKNETERVFLIDQRDVEIKAARFSKPFGSELLPGMNTVPVHSVPKPQSDMLRLVVDHSAGPFSLNSMIDRQNIAGVKLDGIRTLGDSIRAHHSSGSADRLVIWKSDVAAAYRQMPMHPLWQIKQVVRIDNQLCVDRCNNFGGRGSQKIWASFASLVLWIAVYKFHIARSSVMSMIIFLLPYQVISPSTLHMMLFFPLTRSNSFSFGTRLVYHMNLASKYQALSSPSLVLMLTPMR
jgi:hypothetical protein